MPQTLLLQVAVPLVELQTVVQDPQWTGSVLRLTSQPLATLLSQFAYPELQLIPQVPPVQLAVPLLVEQVLPHEPQFVVVLSAASQPSLGLLLQLEYPLLQVILQTPLLQAGVPLAAEHLVPHALQLLTSALRLTSQPFAALPSQSAKPALQLWIPHTPAVHLGVALGRLHTVPQLPQLLMSVPFTFVSQTVAGLVSHSAKPVGHVL